MSDLIRIAFLLPLAALFGVALVVLVGGAFSGGAE